MITTAQRLFILALAPLVLMGALRPAAGGRPETRAARPARPACGASAPRPDATPALTRSPAP